MMESCFNYKVERVESVVVEDLKKDLFAEFSAIPSDSPLLEKEHLQVYLRIRPFTSAESYNGESQECVAVEPPDVVLLKPPRTSLSARLSDKSIPQTAQRFQFSRVYGPETTQKEMFDGTVKCLVKDVLEGGNSLVFTYGVTNAGKTFTFLGSDGDAGILPRSLNVIFNSIEDRIYRQMNIKPHRCREFTRLTKDQQDEEATNKRNILRLSKESDSQKSMASQLSSTCRTTLLEGSTMSDAEVSVDADSFSLDVDSHTKYSVWVSFCEIYNENIHDLLDPLPNGSLKRTVLRLSQDVKGNSFVKDLKWVQVNDADEAYKVVKVGKKNQSFSCTKLNNLSSRSHSIFSIRILRIEDVGIPRVHTISELSLCDLAGSERCAKTQNKGDRLKEAGNINTSLLILGKCINALRHNQQSKLQQHVPFRESKLTHYLQGFFCGRGKACMIVNINQCASMYDETLNVLKFSAVAQKVVVLNTKPLPVVPKKSAREVSFIINNADRKNLLARARKSSLVGWEMGLEDLQENDDDEEEEEEEEDSCVDSILENTIREAEEGDEEDIEIDREAYENQLSLIEELKQKLCREEVEKLAMESRIREEVTKEFMELFSKMESDYSERLAKEKEIIEERAERRLEILKNLVSKNTANGEAMTSGTEHTKDKVVLLDGMIDSMQDDLAKIKKDAEAAQTCLVGLPDEDDTIARLEKQVAELSEELLKTQQLLTLKTNEVQTVSSQTQKSSEELEEAKRKYESQTQKFQELMEICQEKDDMISKLQTAMDHHVENAINDRALIDTIKDEILHLKKNCKCSKEDSESCGRGGRKRLGDIQQDLNEQPPPKKGTLEENSVDAVIELQAKCNQKELDMMPVKAEQEALQQQLESVRAGLQEEIRLKDEQMEDLKQECLSLERKVSELLEELTQHKHACEAALSSLEMERKDKAALARERDTLAGERSGLQQDSETKGEKIDVMEREIKEQVGRMEKVLDELKSAKALLVKHNNESREKCKLIESLTQESEQLRQELEKSRAVLLTRGSGRFYHTMDALHKECETVVKESAQKGLQIRELEEELSRVRQRAAEQEEASTRLKQELEDYRGKADAGRKSSETDRQAADELRRERRELEAEVASLREQVAALEVQLKTSEAGTAMAAKLEKELAERDAAAAALQRSLEEARSKLADVESAGVQETRRKEAERRRELLKAAEEAIAQKDAELEKKTRELSKLKEEMISGLEQIRALNLDLQRKEDDASDMKEKLADSKKQIQQVQKEISSMREEEKSLRQKLNDSERMRNQMLNDLHSKDQIIQQLKSEQASVAKSDENLQRYQKACSDLQAKEQVIEAMRLALTEQEETQAEQDKVLDAKLDEIESLTEELNILKERFLQQNMDAGQHTQILEECCSNTKQETEKAEERLKLANEKYQADKKKWLEEKLLLINQVKEAEEKRNQEMKKFADDRARHGKLLMHVESLSKQLSEKDDDLQKWRKERDTLVAALEVQMQKLVASNSEKDKKLKELQSDSSCLPQENIKEKVAELQCGLLKKDSEILELRKHLKILSGNANKFPLAGNQKTSPSQSEGNESAAQVNDVSSQKPQDDSNKGKGDVGSSRSSEESEVSVLESSDVSTENGRPSRFPKPELEIQFTPLQPNKMCVRQQGEDSAVTVKITRTGRKRKSAEMEKDPVESENRKNTRYRGTPRMTAQRKESPAALGKRTDHMRQQESQSSLKSKKDGTLQKIGDFIQSSPTLLGSKAKKIIGFVSAKSPEPEGSTATSFKPKKSKRKLYKTEISSPLDIPSHPIIGLDQDEKESDHLIIKRRLRTRTKK
ncbi:kinesin-like protein KIF20B [Megalops cyprinoides]|uniref:kinesin-like protein KIF20B n=1 Tax=Megalops cyprinoides TaxID=118141 RepID=UPI001863FCDE|nr:kinesin-like protein KIF20B [Megalops cyprinoides]